MIKRENGKVVVDEEFHIRNPPTYKDGNRVLSEEEKEVIAMSSPSRDELLGIGEFEPKDNELRKPPREQIEAAAPEVDAAERLIRRMSRKLGISVEEYKTLYPNTKG